MFKRYNIYYLTIFWLSLLLLFIKPVIASDPLEGEIALSFSNATETTIDIEYASDVTISGYQFSVNGVDLINATDGDLEIFANNNIVVGFGLGISLPACPEGGCSFASLLFYGNINGSNISLSDVIILENSDSVLAVSGPGSGNIPSCTNGDGDELCDDIDDTPGGEILLSFSNPDESTIDIEYTSDVSIAGYQFSVDGVDLINATDGDLEIFANNNIVVGFGLGISLPACPDGGCALASLLFYGQIDGGAISLSDIIVVQNSDYELAVDGPENTNIPSCTNGDGDIFCDDVDETPGGEILLSFSNATETTIDLEYASDVSIAGYQFSVDGVDLINASDGDLEIFANNNIVVGFGLGISLPACPEGGCTLASLLFYAKIDGGTISLSDIIVVQNSDYELAVDGPEVANFPSPAFTYEIELSEGANLVSFHSLPINTSVDNVLLNLGDNAQYIIGEGSGAYYQSGIWYGSLQNFYRDEGYWLAVEESQILSIDESLPTSIYGEWDSGAVLEGNNLVYDLHSGNNLISYPFSIDQDILSAIDESYYSSLYAIAGSGLAARLIDGFWYGSMVDDGGFKSNNAYWIIAYENVNFQFNRPENDNSGSRHSRNEDSDVPDLFMFEQSPYQAFYWVEYADINGIPLEEGEDWIGAFYGDQCVGARIWSGENSNGIPTDVPVMGQDADIPSLQNYIIAGQYPSFVIYDASEDIYFNANAYDNHVFEGQLLKMYTIENIKVEEDCCGELGYFGDENSGNCVEDNCGECGDPNDPSIGWPCVDDCLGVPNGDAVYDDCGICCGGETGITCNSSMDDCGVCDGQNEDIDCNGDCFGYAVIDDCGVCGGGNTGKDCTGTCPNDLGYGAEIDSCGICSGGNSDHEVDSDIDDCGVCFGENLDKDCNGDCFGGAYIDNCSQCSDGNSGHEADSDKDCNGDCFGGAYIDNCDQCSGGNSSHEADSDIDDCGVCFGENLDKDCNDDCFGEAVIKTFYYDSDGDGLGSDESSLFCDVAVPEGWVENHADIDDNCFSNYHDCMDECDGSAQFGQYWRDQDGDGLGFGLEGEFCSGNIPTGWVPNEEDMYPDCFSNFVDCAGVCDGEATVDTYWNDDDGDGLGNGIEQEFCIDSVPNGWVLNSDDEDDNCYSNYHDCAGDCNGNAQIKTYYYDNDGDGLGNGITEEFCDALVEDSWVLNNDDEDDNCYSNIHDCLGICDGETIIDSCGICNGDNSLCSDECGIPNGDNSTCLDECGVPNGDNSSCLDCAGVPNGDSVLDNCGVCDNNLNNDCNYDCAGEWGGDAEFNTYYVDIDGDGLGAGEGEEICEVEDTTGLVLNNDDEDDNCFSNIFDECGICNGDNSSCLDCSGVPNGDASLDNCGVCDNNLGNDCNYDCIGIENGEAFLDDCGVCSGGSTGHVANSDIDLCGECFGEGLAQQGCGCFNGAPEIFWYDFDNDGMGTCTIVDGECLPCDQDDNCELICASELPVDNWADNTDDDDDNCFSNYHDCTGLCDGEAIINTYWNDDDGDGLGNGIEQEFCSGVVPSGWVLNNNDEDDNCFSNYHDCIGLCDGEATVDTYWNDDDGDGLGNGIGQEFCSGVVPSGWVLNNDDTDDSCYSNIFDCSGTCDGEATIDTYWNDDDGDGLGNGIEQEFCSTDVSVGWVSNSDDEDDNCYSNYHDCSGVCNGFEFINTYYSDNDEDGLGAGFGFEYCSTDIPSGWVLNSDDEDDNCYSNYHDCAGVCDGAATIDTYWNDDDGDGLGNGIEGEFCSSDELEGWATNNDDQDDNCYSNYHDCAGICDGEATVDTYWNDDDGDGFGNGIEQDFCSTDNLDGWVLNSDDEDDNCYSNYHDCAGVCDGEATVDTYWNDDDGDGLGNGIEQDFCSADNLDGWVLNSDDIDDNCYSNIFDCSGVCDGSAELTVFCEDVDGDGLGDPAEKNTYCSDSAPEGWVPDCSDIEPDCFSNFIDECGICDGDNSSCSGCTDPQAWNYDCLTPSTNEESRPNCNDDVIVDDGSCIYTPSEFIFNVSQSQGFYILEDVEIKLDQIEDIELLEDWVAVFIDGVCVGSYPWLGSLTTIPAMGYDGSALTQGYLESGDEPIFYIYDASIKEQRELELLSGYMSTDVSISTISGEEYAGWSNFEFFWIDYMLGRGPDCSGMEMGTAFLDDCGLCICGEDLSDETPLGCYEGTPNEFLDCAGVCDPSTPVGSQGLEYGAFIDDCGVCSGGITDHIANSDDLDCGCFNPAPASYWLDVDKDGYGYGESSVELCLNDVTDFYTDNNLDNEPNCPNPDIETSMIDECGDCVGIDVDDFNANMDNFGVCCEQYLIDECGICFGDGSSCNKPIVENLNLQIDEDNALDILLIGSDPNEDPISFMIVDEPAYGTISGTGANLIYTPDLNYNGVDSFTFKAMDDLWSSDLGTVDIIISPINDMPIANNFSITTFEDSSIVFDLLGTDVDLDELVYSLSTFPENGSVALDSNQVVYTPYSNYFGFDSFNFIVSDSELNSNEAIIDISVSAVPDAPYLLEIPDSSINEGEIFTYEISFGDDDDDELSFFVQSNNSNSSVVDGNLIVVPSSDYAGSIEVTITISDGVYNVNQTFILEVIPINDPPYILPIVEQTLLEDESLVLEIITSDPDGDDVEISVSNPNNASIQVQNNIVTLIPETNFNGMIDVTVYAADLEFSVSTSFLVNVLPVNDPPELINTIGDIVVLENSDEIEIDLSEIFYDVENQYNLSYSISENIDGLITNIENSILTLAFLNEVSGYGIVDIAASDNLDRAIVSTSFSVEIIPSNDPPIAELLSLELDEDSELEIQLNATDPENDPLSYSIVNQPENGSISFLSENIYIYTPGSNYFGSDSFTFEVSDGEHQVESTVSLLIIAVNDPPYFITTTLSDGAESDPYQSIIEVGDVDNLEYELVLSLASAPNWLTTDGMVLIGNPHSTSAGTYGINLELFDGEDISVTTLSLNIESTISAPFVQNFSVNLLEDSSKEIVLYASGTIDSILVYNIMTAPSNGTISGTAPHLLYTPEENFSGEDQIVFTAANGDAISEEAIITINVLPVNDPPTAIDLVVDIDSVPYLIDFNESVTDLDNDDLLIVTLPASENNVLQTLLGGTLTPIGNLIYEYYPPESSPESDFLLFKVTDGIVTSNMSVLTMNLFGRSWSRFNPPMAFDDEAIFFENEITEISFAGFDVFYNFPLDGTEIVTITEMPQHGTLTEILLSESSTSQLAVWNVNYMPDLDYEGTDTIKYKVSNPNNSNGISEEGTISITINGVDELPQIEILSEINLDEDITTEISFNAYDDNDIDLSVSSSNDLINVVIINDSTISIIPEPHLSGSALVSLTAQEIGGFQRDITEVINVNVLPVNDPPVLENINDMIIDEDEIITLSISANDIDYVLLNFNIFSESENLSTSIVNNIITLSGKQDYFGEETFSIIVTDNEGASDTQDITVNILPVNDMPVMRDFNDVKIVEDSLIVIFPDVSDVDNTDLNIFAQSSENIEVTVFDEDDDRHGALLIIPNSDWNGSENIVVSVTDGEFIVENNLVVEVESVNDAPILNVIPNQQIDEDNSIDLVLSISNEEGDFLTYSVVSDGGMLTSISNNILSITPPLNYNGQTSLIVEVFDGEFSDYTSFILAVDPINDLPVLNQPFDNLVLIEDSESINIILGSYFDDVDGDNLIYNIELNSNEIVETSLLYDILTINPIENQFGGPIIATITTTDQNSENLITASFEIFVSGVNDTPLIMDIDNPQIQEDGIFTYSLEGFDYDGDELIYVAEMDSLLGSLSIFGNLLSISPKGDFNGDIDISAIVSDGVTFDSTAFTLTVNPVNDAPIVSEFFEDLNIDEDSETLTIGLSSIFLDVDEDSLAYEFNVNSESIVTVDIVSDSLIISAVQDQYGGPISISVRATDLDGLSSSYNSFSINVEPVNDIPVISSVPFLLASEDIEYVYEIEIEDVDSDNFYYNLSTYPNGMSIDTVNGIISWTPEQGIFSSGLINLYVWDNPSQEFGVDAPAYQEFTIEVIAVNDAPVITSSAPTTAVEDDLYTYQVLASDEDDIEFTYDLLNEPYGMIIDSTGLINWIPENGVLSSGNVTVLVADGGEDGVTPAQQEFLIVVIPVNDPPIIVSYPTNLEIMELDTFLYQIVVEDIDDDAFYYVLQDAPEGMTIDASGLVQWVPQYQGQYGPITILVSDGGGEGSEPATQEIIITVNPLSELINYCYNFKRPRGANLISFPGLPADSSIANVFASLEMNVSGVITEGAAANQISSGVWVGSIMNISAKKGYWIIIDQEAELCIEDIMPSNPLMLFDLKFGVNLVSFPSLGFVTFDEALSEIDNNYLTGVITDGAASTQISPGMWVGSLDTFDEGVGYWLVSTEDYTFQYGISSDALTRNRKIYEHENILLDGYNLNQSTQQAFYFIKDIIIEGKPITEKDWVLVYNNKHLVGMRKWNGLYTDIPAMGYDNRLETSNYSKIESNLTLEVLRETGEIVYVKKSLPTWENNGLFIVSTLVAHEIPTSYNLNEPYPNPFNPITNIQYDIAHDVNMELSIYDMRGRLVEVLHSGYIDAGSYEKVWNAENISSGIYFLRMITPESSFSQKMVLIK